MKNKIEKLSPIPSSFETLFVGLTKGPPLTFYVSSINEEDASLENSVADEPGTMPGFVIRLENYQEGMTNELNEMVARGDNIPHLHDSIKEKNRMFADYCINIGDARSLCLSLIHGLALQGDDVARRLVDSLEEIRRDIEISESAADDSD